MENLIELLESFNRKERFFLAKQALGHFELDVQFRNDLGKTTGITIPADAFAAMDYHLDWLVAALAAYSRGDNSETFDNSKQAIRGNQEDVDLLVAFETEAECEVLLVEAKGDTSWTNSQMRSKAKRLGQIFGDDGNKCRGVKPHLCLISPAPPVQLNTGEWPSWMRAYNYLELEFPENRKTVTRCDADGKTSAGGQHFRIDTDKEGQ